MVKAKLPAADKAMSAAHVGGAHDGPPYGKPKPDVCRLCAQNLAEQQVPSKPLDLPVKALKPPKAKDTGGVAYAAPNVLPPAPIPTPVKVMAEAVTAEKAAGTFSTDLLTAEEPRTREEWMLNAVAVMRGWFPEEHPVPEVRVSIGWPAGRGSSRFIGQCFYAVADHQPALFVAPSLAEVPDILETLLHECIHAACPVGTGHKGLFVTLARGLGFIGPWRSTPASPELKTTLADLAVNLGPFPHSKVLKSDTTRPSVQNTRMLKATCPVDGCLIRMTQKWVDEVGVPTCACGEAMEMAA